MSIPGYVELIKIENGPAKIEGDIRLYFEKLTHLRFAVLDEIRCLDDKGGKWRFRGFRPQGTPQRVEGEYDTENRRGWFISFWF